MSRNILFIVIVAILFAGPTAVAQQLESYGLSISGNSSWARLDLEDVIIPDLLDEQKQKIGGGIGVYAIWSSPLQGRLKTQLEFARRHYVINTNSYKSCYNCQTSYQIGPRTNHIKMDVLSLTLAPIFNLSAIQLERAYIFGGAQINYFLSHQTEIREETGNGTVVMNRNNMDRFWDHVGYGGTFGLGIYLFDLFGRNVTIDFKYSFEINTHSSAHRGMDARNRALELGLGVNL